MACDFCGDQCCSLRRRHRPRQRRAAERAGRRFRRPHRGAAKRLVHRRRGRGPRIPHRPPRPHQEQGGKCVFLNPKGRGCQIHGYALEKGIDYHALKPMVSTPLSHDLQPRRPGGQQRSVGQKPRLRRRRADGV
ncbi:MAG: hypothetical protein WDM81_02205 [Rhizomicrobium sp.]